MKILICQYCGKEFSPKNRTYTQKCCCKSCGQKLAIKLGRKPKLFKKGNTSWNKGLKGFNAYSRPAEWKNNMKKSIKRRWDIKGRKSSKNQLLRKSPKFKEWREGVFERDNFTCQNCGARSKKGKRIIIHPHHIKQLAKYPELAYDVNNGITLCEECHKKLHKSLRNKNILIKRQ